MSSWTLKPSRSSPLIHEIRSKTTYWELKPVKTSIRKSVCSLHGDGGVKLGSFTSSPHAALAKVIEGAGYSLLVICATLFLGTLVTKGLASKHKKKADGNNQEKMAKNVSSAATKLIDIIRNSKWVLETTLAGTLVGAVTIFMSQGLRRSFIYTGTDGEKMKALPLAGYGGRVYEIISSDKALPVYYAYPNQRTGNWELFGKPEGTVTTTPDSAVETERMFLSSDTSPVKVPTDALQQKADGLFGNQAPLFSVSTVLGQGRGAAPKGTKKSKEGIVGVSTDMNVTLPGAGTHRMPISMAGFGRTVKMPVPRDRQQERVYKVRAMMCYMARTCSTLSIDIFALFAFGAMVPYLVYKGATGAWWGVNSQKIQHINDSETNFSEIYKDVLSDDPEVATKAREDWKNAWTKACQGTRIKDFMEQRGGNISFPVGNTKVMDSLKAFVQCNDDGIKECISNEIERFKHDEKLPEYVEYMKFLEDLRQFVAAADAVDDDMEKYENIIFGNQSKSGEEYKRAIDRWEQLWLKKCLSQSNIRKYFEEMDFKFHPETSVGISNTEDVSSLKGLMDNIETDDKVRNYASNVIKKLQRVPEKNQGLLIFWEALLDIVSSEEDDELKMSELEKEIKESDPDSMGSSMAKGKWWRIWEKWCGRSSSKMKAFNKENKENKNPNITNETIESLKKFMKITDEDLDNYVNELSLNYKNTEDSYTKFIHDLNLFLKRESNAGNEDDEGEGRMKNMEKYENMIFSNQSKAGEHYDKAWDEWIQLWYKCVTQSNIMKDVFKLFLLPHRIFFQSLEPEEFKSMKNLVLNLETDDKLRTYASDQLKSFQDSNNLNQFYYVVILSCLSDEEKERKLDHLETLIFSDQNQNNKKREINEWLSIWTLLCVKISPYLKKLFHDSKNDDVIHFFESKHAKEVIKSLKGFTKVNVDDTADLKEYAKAQAVSFKDREHKYVSFLTDLTNLIDENPDSLFFIVGR